MGNVVLAYFAVTLIGSLVAIAELISRYRDDPARAVFSGPASLYVVVNGAASAGALYVAREMDWSFGAPDGVVDLWQVLGAGFGAIALFRTSLFNATIGDQVIGVGPSVVLNVLLSAADRAVDRKRAKVRMAAVSEIMKDFDFAHADSLRQFCLSSMQNAQQSDRDEVSSTIRDLRDQLNAGVPDAVKSLILGLALVNIVGDDALREALRRIEPALNENRTD